MQDQAQGEDKFEGMETIHAHVDTWQNISEKNTKVERLGGLSNKIWKVTAKSKKVEPRTVIYREFGSGAAIVDRERENYVIEGLAKKGIAPKYFGGDEERRVEEFCESELLKPSDLNEKSNRRKLTRLLAELHSMKFDKLDKTPLFLRILNGNDFLKSFEDKCKQDVFQPVEKKLIKEISTLASKDEIEFLKSIAPKGEKSVVFSHNDLHSQNVLVLDKNNKFQLIDYEYSDYNYRGYDIANLFNETMFEYDLEEAPHYSLDESKYPSDKDLRDFIKFYLFFSKYDGEDFDLESILKHDSYRDEYVQKRNEKEAFDKEAEEIFQEVKVCAMFSHYFWSIWGIIMSYDGDFKFDHVHYATKRFEIYKKLKEQYLKEHGDKEGLQDQSAP